MKPKTRLEWFLAKIAGDADATGTVTPKTRKEYYLKEIADNGGGGGSSLPAVTASDNGSVLAVVDGAWDKATPSNALLVHASDADFLATTTLDKTFAEIADAIDSGIPVYVVAEYGNVDSGEDGYKLFCPVIEIEIYTDFYIHIMRYSNTQYLNFTFMSETIDGVLYGNP